MEDYSIGENISLKLTYTFWINGVPYNTELSSDNQTIYTVNNIEIGALKLGGKYNYWDTDSGMKENITIRSKYIPKYYPNGTNYGQLLTSNFVFPFKNETKLSIFF